MNFIKLQADAIFDGYRLHTNKVLVMRETGMVEGLIPAEESGDGLRSLRGILSPGFINCHCHLELSHLKGLIPEKTGLPAFVSQVVARRNAGREVIEEAIANSETAMLANGIVATGDICNTTDTLSQKRQHRMYYHNFIEVLGFDPAAANASFERFEAMYRQFRQTPGGHCVSLTPHAPYSVSRPLWEKTIHYPGNRLMSIHNQETAAENEWFLSGRGSFGDLYRKLGLDASSFEPSGKSSLRTYLQRFADKQQLILVHNVHTSPEDILFAQQLPHDIFWCLCPNANRYISDQLPAADLFLENGCQVTLGTDSLASNHQLHIWQEIQTISEAFPGIPLPELLKWATSNGARALQIEDRFGSFEKGKQPGVVIINEEAGLLQL